MPSRAAFVAILIGGGIAGALDIAYAIGFSAWRGMPPEKLLQLVASGLLGMAAYEGGNRTAALGLAIHFAWSFVFAAIYYAAALSFELLTRQAVWCGLGYGVLVFLFMNFVALPLSAFPHPLRFSWLGTGTNLLSHLFFFGLPIALATRAALRPLR